MRWIHKLVKSEKKLYKDKVPYYLHTYEIIDENDNVEEVQNIYLFDEGDKVNVWFNEQYNQVKMIKAKGKNYGQYKSGRSKIQGNNDKETREL